MSVTSGFYNSLNGDRKYNAEQMSAIFDGVINDGILANIGTAFAVSASSGNVITVGIGRAWFNSTWVYNDAILPITADDSEVLLDRYDAVVIEVDRSDSVRAADIKIIEGTPSSSPTYPTLESSTYIHQYPLAYIYREAGSSEITQADITSMIGKSSCPYVTGILQVQSIDTIVAQWYSEWYQWFTSLTSESAADIDTWIGNQQTTFNEWFSSLQDLLDEDAETSLAARVLALETRWDVLEKNHYVYSDILDSNGDAIEDSYGDVIEGKVVFQTM